VARPPKHAIAADELARLAGVSVPQLRLHQKAGAPVPKTKADIQKWLPEYHAWRDQHRRTPGPAPAQGDPQLLEHKREIAKLRALRDRISLAKEQRQLIPRQQVIDYASEAVLAANQRFDAMQRRAAARLGPLCQGGAAVVEAILAEEMASVRAALAEGMQRTHDGDS